MANIAKVDSFMWSLAFQGVALDDDRRTCVESIDIDDCVYGACILNIKIRDMDLKFIDDNILIEAAKITFTLNMVGSLKTILFEGYVSALDMDFNEEGVSLSLSCRDKTYLMNRDEVKKTWKKKKSTQVVQEIAKKYGFGFETDDGYNFKVQSSISQSDKSDIDFCEDLAANEDEMFYCKYKNGVVYYKQYKLGTPVLTLAYRQTPYNLRSFHPAISQEKVKRSTVTEIQSTTMLAGLITEINPDFSVFGENTTIVPSPASSVGYTFNVSTGAWAVTTTTFS